MLFDKLEVDYADGLLCDVTERAINDWWLETGGSHYNIEPHDGILGPTTVAGLLGLLMGARNRLHAVGAPVGKDAFDVEAMKRGIGHFQKQQRVGRTRRLDRKTLDRLHRMSAKAANSEGWTVPKAVKSTVAELSGKGGEMVLDVVGRRDKAGIAEIETCDIDRFVQLVYGERARWLWYGKPLKKSGGNVVGAPFRLGEEKEGLGGKTLMFKEDESGGYSWTARKSVAPGMENGKKGEQQDEVLVTAPEQDGDEDGFRGVLKRTSGFKEARSGFGRIKGAVGLGSHHHYHKSNDSKDEVPQTPRSPRSPNSQRSPNDEPSTPVNQKDQQKRPGMRRSQSSPVSSIGSPQSPVQEQKHQQFNAEPIPEQSGREVPAPAYATSYREAEPRPSKESDPPSYASKGQNEDGADTASDHSSETVTVNEPSVAGSVYNEVDLNETLPTGPETEVDVTRLLRRTVSHSRFITTSLQSKSEDAYPRHLSFSLAEESILTWEDIVDSNRDPYAQDTRTQLADENFIAKGYQHLRHLISELQTSTATFTQDQLQTLTAVLEKMSSDTSTLDALYQPHAEHLNTLQTSSDGILRDERERLAEAGKQIEGLAAKLEYEIGGLKGRVEDVEGGVEDFEKGVGRVEDRVGELEKEGARDDERGWGCVVS